MTAMGPKKWKISKNGPQINVKMSEIRETLISMNFSKCFDIFHERAIVWHFSDIYRHESLCWHFFTPETIKSRLFQKFSDILPPFSDIFTNESIFWHFYVQPKPTTKKVPYGTFQYSFSVEESLLRELIDLPYFYLVIFSSFLELGPKVKWRTVP